MNGSMLALGVAFMPITKLFGPVVTWNIFCVWQLQLRRLRCVSVLRRWTTWWPAAFFGGLIYAFSVYSSYLSLYIFLICSAPTIDLPAPPRNPGATEVATGKDRGSSWSCMRPAVLDLYRDPWRNGSDLRDCDRPLIGDASPDAGGAVAAPVTAFGSCAGVCAFTLYPVWFTFAGPQHLNGPPETVEYWVIYAPPTCCR